MVDRYLVREEYEERVQITKAACPAGSRSKLLKIWTYHYSDGAVETVTVTERKK